MTKLVYILSDYEEHGAENVRVCTSLDGIRKAIQADKEKSAAETMSQAQRERFTAYYAEALESLETVDPNTPIWKEGRDMQTGWGGYQLHIVELQ